MIHLTKLDDIVCGPTASIREALERINRAPQLFLIVLDAEGRLLGTVTDGDVRRAMIAGVTLDDPVEACMQRQPRTGRVGADADNLERLRGIGGLRAFLPLVDESGIVREVLAAAAGGEPVPAALIMAGGRGSRLGERTRDTPKPLLPVGEQPILERVLQRLEAAGVQRIFVAVHYLADQIEAFLKAREHRVAVQVVREERPLGTAGAIAKLPLDGQPLLVLNGDVLTRVEISSLVGFHHRHDFDATIAVAQHQVNVPYGVVRHADDGTFLGVEEKPSTTHFVAAGMYYLSPEMAALVPADQPIDMPDLLNLGRRVGLRIGLFPIHEYWVDIGRPEDLAVADEDHRSEP